MEIFSQEKCFTLSMMGNLTSFLSSADFFKINILKKYFRNRIRASNSLNPDQARCSV